MKSWSGDVDELRTARADPEIHEHRPGAAVPWCDSGGHPCWAGKGTSWLLRQHCDYGMPIVPTQTLVALLFSTRHS